MTQLVPALLDLLVIIEDAVHGAYGTMVLTFVQKGCIDLIGCLIQKPVGEEYRALPAVHLKTRREEGLGAYWAPQEAHFVVPSCDRTRHGKHPAIRRQV